MINLYCISRQP